MKQQLKKITYKQFCEKFRAEYGNGLKPQLASEIAKKHGYKIVDLHNIVQDAKDDGRL
jgi:hypothetical protein